MSAKMFSLLVLQVFLNIAVSEGLEYLGCFKERSPSDPLFKGDFKDFISSNTLEMCWMHCASKGYNFAAVQFGTQCFCSNDRPSNASLADSEEECNMACAGDMNQICGDYMRLGVYSLEEDAIALSYVGCYSGVSLTRTSVLGPLTRENCKDSCARMGQRYFAMEGGSRCHCGSDLKGYMAREEECRAPCDGDRTQICGGDNQQFSIYRTGVQEEPQQSSTTKKPKHKSSSSSSSSSSSEEKKNKHKNKKNSQKVAVKESPLGCYEDKKGKLFVDFILPLPKQNTPKMCLAICGQWNYKFAGLQSDKCFCSNKKPDKKYSTKDKECNVRCPGDAKNTCGGKGATNVYEIKY